MRLIQIIGIFSLFLIGILLSCNQNPPPSKSDSFAERLMNGKANEREIDSLMEAHGVMGSYELKVPKDHFEVTFPVREKHVKSSESIQVVDGKEVEIYQYAANMQHANDENLAYQVSYNYMDDIKSEHDIKQLFDDQRDYWLSATNSQLEVERVIDLNGIPGRSYYFTVDGSNTKTHNNIYYHKGVFYRLVVVTKEGNLFNKSISKFLDSFKITD
jgi:hypothetical protein